MQGINAALVRLVALCALSSIVESIFAEGRLKETLFWITGLAALGGALAIADEALRCLTAALGG